MKTIVKLSMLFAFSFLLGGCEKEHPTPPPTTVTLSQSSVTVEVGKTIEISITKGKDPYKVEGSSSVATATVSGNTITVKGVSAGTVNLTVKGSDDGAATLKVTVTADPYEAFKNNNTNRYERTSGTIKNEDGGYEFRGGVNVNSPGECMFGYSGNWKTFYYFINWKGGYSVGAKTTPTLHTQTGIESIYSLDIILFDGETVWVVYKRTPTSPEERFVQKVKL